MESVNPYVGPLTVLRAQLGELKKKSAELDRRRTDANVELEHLGKQIEKLEKGIELIASVAGENPQRVEVSGLGLTKAVQAILDKAATSKTPKEIRTALLESGYDLSKSRYSDAVSSISTTLKRLVERGRVEESSDRDRKLYRSTLRSLALAKIGKRGGRSRSRSKIEATRRNIAKATAVKRSLRATATPEPVTNGLPKATD